MSHIVCDICGTSYPPEETQCPLCGKERDERDLLVRDPETRAEGPREPRMVTGREPKMATKGGRFSPQNVEKKNREREAAAAVGAQNLFRQSSEARPKPPREDPYPDEPGTPRQGGKIAVIVLSVLVVLIGIYILSRFITGRAGKTPAETTPSTTAATEVTKPCSSINLGSSGIKLKAAGETFLLTVKVQPEDTTDQVTFVSGDERVAKVSADGVVTCVGAGETKITVSCGKISAVCKVTCAVEETETTAETTKSTRETTKATEKATESKDNTANATASLNIEDMTLFYAGETAELAVRNAKGSVSWSVDDSSVAVVSGSGTVTAVGYGTTTVRATVGGKTYTCIVRCYFSVPTEPEETTESTTEATTEPTPEASTAPEDGGITSDEEAG